jgi:hypothetical protein
VLRQHGRARREQLIEHAAVPLVGDEVVVPVFRRLLERRVHEVVDRAEAVAGAHDAPRLNRRAPHELFEQRPPFVVKKLGRRRTCGYQRCAAIAIHQVHRGSAVEKQLRRLRVAPAP